MSTVCRLYVDLCLLMSAYVYLCRHMSTYVNICLLMSTYVYLCRLLFVDLCLLFVDYMSTYVYCLSTICRLMSTYVDMCLLMSTICRLYVDICQLMSTICLLMSTMCPHMSNYVDLCLLVSTYVDFTLYKSVQLCHISTTTTTAAMVMDYKAAPTESTPISTPTHTYQCRRLWKLDNLCNHGVIRCLVCKEVYDRKAIPFVHNVNDIA